MNSIAEVNESKVRSQATRKGLKLEKARSIYGNNWVPDRAYRVVDRYRNVVVFGGHPNGYGCSLEDCAEFVQNS
jgi:hypothetical protein